MYLSPNVFIYYRQCYCVSSITVSDYFQCIQSWLLTVSAAVDPSVVGYIYIYK